MRKGEKKILIGVGVLLTVCTILGWNHTLSLAESVEEPASRKTEIIIAGAKGDIAEATVREHIDFDLEHLNIIGRDLEKAHENKGYVRRNTSEDGADRSESEHDVLHDTEADRPIHAGERTEPEVWEVTPEDPEDGNANEVPEREDSGSGSESTDLGEPTSDNVDESISIYSDMGDGEYADNTGLGYSEFSDDSGVDESGYIESEPDYGCETGNEDNSGSLIYLGEWASTGYCPNACCCGQWASGYTASGTLATEGRTVACGSLPMGTEIYIEGYGYRIVEDLGVEGEWVDIFYQDHASASAHGLQYVAVYLVN